MPVQIYSTLAPSALSFSPVRKNQFGGKAVYVNLGSNDKRVQIQTPKMKAPFGHSVFVDDSNGRETHTLTLNYNQDDEFQKIMSAVDEQVKRIAVERAAEWFGRAQSYEVVDALFRPSVAPHPEGKYDPTLKVKIPWHNANPIPEFYNSNQEKVTIGDIENGSQVTCVIELAQIWFVNKSFGASWKLMQCRIHPSNKLKGYCMIDTADGPLDDDVDPSADLDDQGLDRGDDHAILTLEE